MGHAVVSAEAQDNAGLIGLHAIKAARQPEDDDHGDGDRDEGAHVVAARQQLAEPILAATEHFLEIRRARTRPARAGGAASIVVATAAAATTPRAAAASAPATASPRAAAAFAHPDHCA